MRQVILYSSSRVPTLYVKFRFELSRRQEIAIHTVKGLTGDFRINAGAAAAAFGTRRCLQGNNACLTLLEHDRGNWEKGNRIRFAMNGLAVVAMANVLHDWRASQVYFDRAATTSNAGDDQ